MSKLIEFVYISLFFLKYKIIRLWIQVMFRFLYDPANVSQTFMP